MLDFVEKRIEYRRLSDQGRERVKLVYLCCKSCMNYELGELEVDVPLLGGI